MSEARCRWGILGAASIARKNWDAIRNSGNGHVNAVASRSLDRAQQFINECQASRPAKHIPEAVEGYDELLQRDDIDAVYIPLPTGTRKEWVIKAAEAGKHVMCEKPCAVSASDLADMIQACDENNVQFMDGVMYMHSKRMNALRTAIDDGTSVGRLKRIQSHFSFCAPEDFMQDNIRLSSDLEPQGCLGDLGWYTIRLSLFVNKYEMPKQVIGRQLEEHLRGDSPSPVPMEFSGELLFEGGVSAGFYNSFLTEHQQLVHISGSKGNISYNDFVLPWCGNELSFEVNNAVFNFQECVCYMEKHTRTEYTGEFSNNAPDSQETNMFRKFNELALGGKPDPFWAEVSLKTQIVMDACLESARNGSQPVNIDLDLLK
jgi:predicted dehydrogenase